MIKHLCPNCKLETSYTFEGNRDYYRCKNKNCEFYPFYGSQYLYVKHHLTYRSLIIHIKDDIYNLESSYLNNKITLEKLKRIDRKVAEPYHLGIDVLTVENFVLPLHDDIIILTNLVEKFLKLKAFL